MKQITTFQRLSLWLLLFLILPNFSAYSQNPIRCYTNEMDSVLRANNPELNSQEDFENWINNEIQNNANAKIVGGVYQIPVVFHVIHNGEAVGTGTNVSFAAIQSQVDVLNEDFRKMLGTNGWNTNPVGADTEIEFCLAQRRPDGSAFTEAGVNRINRTTAGFTAPPYTTNYIDNTIKTWTYNGGVPTATRGWDPNKYMNIWLCNISGGILGYAQFPQTPLGGMGCGAQATATDGVVFLYNSIGKSSITGYAGPYNEGRTATHEIGHWLGLRHIWGDGGCTVDDYCNDTPIAGAANYGCPNGTNSCTGAPDAGPDQIENYMDYTDDLCMNIFTNDQKMRMRTVLENSPLRANLITSDACTPPNTNDASVVDIINPLGDNCAGSITPTVVLRNRGSNNLTSATISYAIDNGSVTNFSWTGTLTPGSSVNVNLPSFTTTLGIHNFKSYSTLPNGLPDPSAIYDTSSIDFVISNGEMAPFSESFDGGVFPPDIRWVINNPNSDCYRWIGGSATSISGALDNNAALMPSFQNTTGSTENMITPIFILPCNASVANIQFDVAYRRRNNTTANYERLYIEISEDCGLTWNSTPIYDKTGTVLQTVTTTQTTYFIPTASNQWRTETIDLLPFVTGTSKNVKFRFRAVAANGNNIYVDNFRFNATTPGEIEVTQSGNDVLDEGSYSFGSVSAGTPVTSVFTVSNTGTTNLTLTGPILVTGTGFSLETTFGTTTVAPGGATTFSVTFNSAIGGSFTGNVSFGTNDCDEGTYNFILNATTTVTPPVAEFSGTPLTICAGSTVTFTDLSINATSWLWDFGPGATPATSTVQNPTVTFNNVGNNTITLTATNSFGSDVETKTNYITILDATGIALPIVEGFTAATFVPTGWTLVNANASPTSWVRSATIGVAPTAGNSMLFDNFSYNDGDDDEVRLPGANFAGLTSATLSFDVAYAPYDATYFDGLEVLVSSDCGVTYTSVYSKSNTVLGTAPAVTTAFTPTAGQWRNEVVDLTPYVGNSKVIVAFRNLSGYGNRLFVDNINLSGIVSTTTPVASFSGAPTIICEGQTVTYTNTSTGSPTSYSWSFPGGTPATSTATNPTVTYASAGVYDVSLTATNAGGSDLSTEVNYVTVIASPATPGSITGTTAVCSGSTGNIYSITAVSGATSYTWTVPAGATVTSGQGTTSATITFGATSGNVTVTASNGCGTSSASSLGITIETVPTTPGSITGSTTVCSGSTGNVYSIAAVPGATNYTWTVPAGATITSGQGSTSATVTFGSSSGNVTVTASNACGTSTAATLAIAIDPVPATPGSITGATTVCSGSAGNVYSITAVFGATSYTWTVPAGSSITSGQGTTSATITFGSTSGNITVIASNACGNSTAVILGITVNSTPATPGIISGSATACSGSTGNVYSITSVPGATSYTWTVPAGSTVSSGQGTNSATIAFGSTSGNVTVSTSNSCGTSSPATLAVTLTSAAPATPGTITGLTSVCEGSTGNVYSISSVTGATNYTWNVPVGSNITSGQGTTSIEVTFGSGSGNISVTASSSCGTSAANSQAIIVNSIPSAPITSVNDNCGNSVLSATGSNLLWSTTETTASITVTNSGTYTVTQTVNGCTSSAATVSANPLVIPSSPIVSATDDCGNSVLTATGSNLVWSTSETTSSITVTIAGTYTVTQSDGTCVSAPSPVNANPVMSAPTPVINVTNSCGSSILTSDATGSVLWSTGETVPTIMVTSAGTYTITQNIGGCISAAGSGVASPTPIPPTPVITVADECGRSVLSTTATGSLMWSTSETTPTIIVTTPGIYYVSQTVGGCTSAAGSVTANPMVIPNVTFSPLSDVCINSPSFLLTQGSPSGGTYSGPGVAANQFDPSVAGYGTFTLTYTFTDVNGCSDSNEQPITVGCAEIEDLGISGLIIYPNPTNGIFTVKAENDHVESIYVFDYAGRLVLELIEQNDEITIDLSYAADGVYSLVVNSGKNTFKEKIVLIK